MRWKIRHLHHDPRHVDLLAVFALLIIVVAACEFLSGTGNVPKPTGLIVPSQTVRW